MDNYSANAAITLSSIAIGVGKAVIWIVVRVGFGLPSPAKLAEGVTRVQLTPREMATLRLMADGKANKEIASELDISERTVKTHLGHLFGKLGVTSRTEAVKVATRRGLVRLE